MIQLAFWLTIFALAPMYMSIGISSAGEGEARMLRSWRRVGWGLLAAAVVFWVIATVQELP